MPQDDLCFRPFNQNFPAPRIWRDATLQKALHGLHVAAVVQRRVALPVPRRCVRPMLEQQPQHVTPATLSRQVQSWKATKRSQALESWLVVVTIVCSLHRLIQYTIVTTTGQFKLVGLKQQPQPVLPRLSVSLRSVPASRVLLTSSNESSLQVVINFIA